MYTLSDILVFAGFLSFAMLWWNAQGAKQRALESTRAYCKRMDLQLLDDVVALRGFWFKRDRGGRLHLWRSYNFEFSSTGSERYQGRIILLGFSVESIELEPHRLH